MQLLEVRLMTYVTYAPKSGAKNRLHFLASVFGAGFW